MGNFMKDLRKKDGLTSAHFIIIVTVLLGIIVMLFVVTLKLEKKDVEPADSEDDYSSSAIVDTATSGTTTTTKTGAITEAELKSAFNIFSDTEALEEAGWEMVEDEDISDLLITVNNGKINISSNGEKYVISYDLSDKPTFTVSVDVYQGMSYDEYEEKTQELQMPRLGYVAVANTKGVSLEDSLIYMILSMLGDAFNSSSDTQYTILDDREGELEVLVDDSNTILASEFGSRAMEYINSEYGEKSTITDSELGSFTWTTEETNVTSTSATIVSTLVVNTDVDFSLLNGVSETFQNGLSASFEN
jgi:hypothetical protein